MPLLAISANDQIVIVSPPTVELYPHRAPERARFTVVIDELAHRAIDNILWVQTEQASGAIVEQADPAALVERYHAGADRSQDRLNPGLLPLERSLTDVQLFGHRVECAL
jgi:hypothetical protein